VDTAKDTQRALVRLSYDGRVYKEFRGPKAEERFANEVKVLRYLESVDCPFVPRLIEEDPDKLQIVTTSAGTRVQHLDESRALELFAELEQYGVHHDDRDVRNVTYRQQDGRFCLIDFEFATIMEGDQAGGFTQAEAER
jgi:predicted Ser/Thr protein kinase